MNNLRLAFPTNVSIGKQSLGMGDLIVWAANPLLALVPHSDITFYRHTQRSSQTLLQISSRQPPSWLVFAAACRRFLQNVRREGHVALLVFFSRAIPARS